jgi:hypothetical protein
MTEPAKPRMRDGLIKRGGSWYFVLDEPRDPATGKRRQKWVNGGRTRKEAEQARDDARARRRHAYADLEAGGLARSTVRLFHTRLHRALATRFGGICWCATLRISST